MRYAIAALVAAALLTLPAFVAGTPGYAQKSTEVSSAKKKKQKDEYLKAAPSAPPKGQSTY